MNPATPAASDAQAVNLGMRFRSSVYGTVDGLRFYKGSGNTGTHTGSLWSITGQLLAQGTFTNESATGIQALNFSSPVAINPNTAYVVSYHAPVGRYSINNNFAWPITVSPLTAEAGVFAYGAVGYPSQTWQNSNYWVDVIFTPGEAPPPPPPPTGTASLAWDAHQDPTVTGYRVYSRLNSAAFPAYGTGIAVNTNNYSLSALAVGTWCFAVTAVSPSAESAYSTEACKVIQ
jgi:hypothetical protein